MKVFDKVMIPLKRGYSIVTTQAVAHAPEIEIVVGGGCLVASIFLAYRAGRKAQKEQYREHLEEDLHEIKIARGPSHIKTTNRNAVVKEYVVATAKNVAPTVLTASVGGFFIYKSFRTLQIRNGILVAALASATASAKAVDENLRDTFGEGVRDEIVTNGTTETMPVMKQNENGEKFTDREEFLVSEIENLPPEVIVYSKSTVCKGDFIDNDDYFEDMLNSAVAEGNLNLRTINGYYFIENFAKPFGVEPNATQKTNGWLYPDPKRPMPGDELLQCGINPYYRKIFIRHEDGSKEKGYLIFPNSDGVIIDRYDKYSLNKLLGRRA